MVSQCHQYHKPQCHSSAPMQVLYHIPNYFFGEHILEQASKKILEQLILYFVEIISYWYSSIIL